MWIDKYGYDLTFFNGVFMSENILQKENDEPKPVVTVEALGSENFENMCSEYANAGYVLSSSNILILPESCHFQTKYVAIFVLPEVLGIDMDWDEGDEDVEGEEWKKGKKQE